VGKRLAYDAGLESREVRADVRQFRHGESTLSDHAKYLFMLIRGHAGGIESPSVTSTSTL
jgi:hypothetical protein